MTRFAILAAAASLFALGACADDEPETMDDVADEMEQDVEDMGNSMEDAGDDLEGEMDEMGDEMEEAGDDFEDSMDDDPPTR
ncbi:MAG: hypothetical protein V2I43_14130 [Parvularcula sp.]|jgi:hypothetical protein|nr:hypothetical protein [Parvularcula sp.]